MRNLKLVSFDLMIGFILSLTLNAWSSSQAVQSNLFSSPKTTAAANEVASAPSSVSDSNYSIDFSKPVKKAYLTGFSGQESWGRWTDGSQASIKFNKDLPNSFKVIIQGLAYGPNVNQDIIIIIGSQQQKFRFSSQIKEVSVEFKGVPANQRTITFTIPKPTSPSQLGQKDKRKLGIGLKTLKIS